jgi:predicted dehydrogenase
MIEKYTQKGSGLPDVAGMFDLYGKPVGFCTEAVGHFIHCVVHDTLPLVSGEDGLKVTQVLEAAERSALTGQSVNL